MNISINESVTNVNQGVDTKHFKDRRKSADKWIYILRSLAIISWGLFFVALLIVYGTSPEHNPTINSYIAQQPSQQWLLSFSDYIYEILWSSAFTSYLCLVLAKHRSRRKKDSKHFNITMLLTVVFVWVTYLLTGI